LKKKLSILENDKKYFFMKRYYLFRFILAVLLSVTALTVIFFFIYLTGKYRYNENSAERTRIFLRYCRGTVMSADDHSRLLTPGQELKQQQTLLTGRDSSAVLEIENGSFIEILPDSLLQILPSAGIYDLRCAAFFLKRGGVKTLPVKKSLIPVFTVATASVLIPVSRNEFTIRSEEDPLVTVIECIRGQGSFIPKTVYYHVSSTAEKKSGDILHSELEGKSFLIKGGQKYRIPRFLGIDQADYYTVCSFISNGDDESLKNYLFKSGE